MVVYICPTPKFAILALSEYDRLSLCTETLFCKITKYGCLRNLNGSSHYTSNAKNIEKSPHSTAESDKTDHYADFHLGSNLATF